MNPSYTVNLTYPLGDLFAVSLQPHNRWGGFKTLRERWFAHLESTRLRPVLLIDEAQEMAPATLSELRLLASARFDSQILLCVSSPAMPASPKNSSAKNYCR